jgi:hypothetical protein
MLLELRDFAQEFLTVSAVPESFSINALPKFHANNGIFVLEVRMLICISFLHRANMICLRLRRWTKIKKNPTQLMPFDMH